MNELCVGVEQIGSILELAEQDPKRRHAESCPRCSALLASYQDFMKAEPGPGSNPQGASAHLQKVLREEIEGAQKTSPLTRNRFFILRPAWGALVLVLALGSFVLIRVGPDGPEQQVLRGGSTDGAPLSLSQPGFLDDGSVRFSWEPLEEADQYQVVLYESDLTELTRSEPAAETEVVLSPRQLGGAAPGSALVWRVIALQGGDEIDRSAPAPFRLP